MKGKISQMDLVTGIFKLLDKNGIKTLRPHQMNAVVAGANLMLKDLTRPFVAARPGMGLAAWLKCDDTGISCLFMASLLADGPRAEYGHPHDPDDFGRCHRFLESVPEARERLHLMAVAGTVWADLVEAWPDLTVMYCREKPEGQAPLLYARMREIIKLAEIRGAAV